MMAEHINYCSKVRGGMNFTFLKKLILLFSQGCIKLIKCGSRHLLCYKRFLFQINAVLFNFLFIKNPKRIIVCTKILSNTTVFNIDNKKKCFLSIKSAYKKDYVTIM